MRASWSAVRERLVRLRALGSGRRSTSAYLTRAALQQSLTRHLAIVNAALDAIVTIDHQGTIVEFNPAAERIFGYSQADAIGREMASLIIPERLREHHRRGMARYLATGEAHVLNQHMELPALRADGCEFPVEMAIVRIGTEDPPLFTGYVRDISERKRAEEHLAFLARASEFFASSLDFDTTMKNIAALAVPTLADWAVVDIASRESDQPYRRLAVVHVDPSKTEFAHELRRKYPPDPEKDRILKAIQTARSELVTDVTDEMLRAASVNEEHYSMLKELGFVSWMIVPLKLRDVSIGAVTFVSSDSRRRFNATDLAHAEEFARRASTAFENSRLYSEAQQANRAKDNFLATLSHELRTPLTSIVGWARMLSDMKLDPETERLAIHAINRSAKIQAELIDDVLDMSRITSGKMRLNIKMVELSEIARAALNTVEPAAQAKAITLGYEHEGSTLVSGDPRRLQQVIWNLLTNAIKFTPRGGKIDVCVEQVDSAAQVTVSDTGQGFAREFGVHLFEPFRQAENPATRTHGGLGLGLSIARHLVEQHGGTIAAESPGVGRGATFRVRIPLRAVRVEEAEASDHDGSARQLRVETHLSLEQAPHLSDLRILFVDDQEDARILFAAILRRFGTEVETAASVSEAIERFEARPFDLVVTDIAMPVRDGYELIDWLNQRPDRDQFRLIALTAFGGTLDRQRILSTGCDEYLRKPVDPTELISTIRHVMGETFARR